MGLGQYDNVGLAERVGNVGEYYRCCRKAVVVDTLESDLHPIYESGDLF